MAEAFGEKKVAEKFKTACYCRMMAVATLIYRFYLNSSQYRTKYFISDRYRYLNLRRR